MADLNLDDLVLLIHTEVASAVTSAQHYGSMQRLSLETVRVRMGQKSTEAEGDQGITLSKERYPLVTSGWLVDVTYRTNQSFTSFDKTRPMEPLWVASRAVPYLASQSVRVLEGVGKIKQAQLHKQGIFRIGQLVKVSRNQEHQLSVIMGKARFRKLKTMARLALAVPTIELPQFLNRIKLHQLLEQYDTEFDRLVRATMAGETRTQLLYWLEQLEFCLDDDFFNGLDFELLMNGAV